MTTRRCTAILSVVASVVSAALAGPLDPPPGPVASTPKIEARTPITAATTPGDIVNMFRITQPGSYYLVGNITGVAGRNGIHVNVAGVGEVTIDLNGFTVRGVPGALDGVNVTSGTVRISNGTVADWPVRGLYQVGGADGVTATNNAGGGIFATGPGHVTRCVATGNGSFGIRAGANSIVSDCIVTGNAMGSNGGAGIDALGRARVERCIVTNNARNTTIGFNAWGIDCEANATVVNCRVDSNGSPGITAGSGGINGGNGPSVTDCTLFGNIGVGIRAGGSAVIARNAVGGTVTGAEAAGILAAGHGPRVEGNYVFGNSVGIRTFAGGQAIVIGNCSTGNLSAAYDIRVGNDAGPIGAAAAATSPWANIAN